MSLFQTKTPRSPYFLSCQMIFSEPREADSRCLGFCAYTRGMAATLGKLHRVDPRTIWKHEAHDFTPWLAENIDRLVRLSHIPELTGIAVCDLRGG
jgi:hypothetical protein